MTRPTYICQLPKCARVHAYLYANVFKNSRGQKLKEAWLKSGSLDAVDACATQLRSHAVKEKNVEKPVTKKMLAEVYHWDENFGCKRKTCVDV